MNERKAMLGQYTFFNRPLHEINEGKTLINTLNAHSYNLLRRDSGFRQAIQSSHILLPDGIGVVWAMRFQTGLKLRKIAGNDLFHYEMNRLHQNGGTCFFLGSSEKTLRLIHERANRDFPGLQLYSYSPPFKAEFSSEESQAMIDAVNEVKPDVLFVGMTAPKQEKWAFEHFDQLNVGHVCCIGAVFDFFAGTVKRAPNWMIELGLEWFYRLLMEPRRMWKRYIIGNTQFVNTIIKEKIRNSSRVYKTEKV